MEKESTANDCPKNDLGIGADSVDEDFCVLTAKRCIIFFLFIVITIKIGLLEDALFFNLCFLQLCSKAYLGVKFGTIEFLTDASFFPSIFFTKSHNLVGIQSRGKKNHIF